MISLLVKRYPEEKKNTNVYDFNKAYTGKFKIGDRVRIVKGYQHGKVGTVKAFDGPSNYPVRIEFINSTHTQICNDSELESVSE